MESLFARAGKQFTTLIILAGLLLLSGCDTFEAYFPSPSPRVFPTLTPHPSGTGTFTPTPTITSTLTPTQITPAQAGTAVDAPLTGLDPDNVTQIDLIVEAGKGIPQGLALSPDGNLLAVATSNGIYLHDPVSLAETLAIQTNEVQQSIAISPDGLIATGDRLGRIVLWDDSGEMQRQVADLEQSVLALAFSTDGAQLAASAWDGSIWVLDMANGDQLLHSLQARQRPARLLAFSPDGDRLYAWAIKESVQIWNMENGRPLEDYYIGKDARGYLPESGAFSPDSTLFAANYGSSIRVSFLQKAATLRLISDIQNPVRDVIISPDNMFLSALQQDTVTVWNLETGAVAARLPLAETGDLLMFSFSVDSRALITLGSDLQRWRIPETPAEEDLVAEAGSPDIYRTSVSAYSQATGEEMLLFMGVTGSVETYDLQQGVLTTLLPALAGGFTSHALSTEGFLAAVGTSEGEVLLRQMEGAETISLGAHDGPVRSLAFSQNGSLLASGGEDGEVLIWDTATQQILQRLSQDGPPQSILFTPDSGFVFVLTRSGIHLWWLANEEIIQSFSGYYMALSGDGVILAASDRTSGIPMANLYRLPSGELFESIPLDGNALALSPDHSLLAMAGRDLTLWSVVDGSLLQRVPDVDIFGALQFSPDGKRLILTAWDGSIRVWGVPE